MSEEIITDVADMMLPFKKHVTLQDVDYGNGTHMLRFRIRELRRFTIMNIDPASAKQLGEELVAWAKKTDPDL